MSQPSSEEERRETRITKTMNRQSTETTNLRSPGKEEPKEPGFRGFEDSELCKFGVSSVVEDTWPAVLSDIRASMIHVRIIERSRVR